MKVPARSAAAMSSSPLGAVTSRPSRVKVTISRGSASASSGVTGSLIGASPLLDVDQELVAEHLDGRADGRGDGPPEHADGGLLGRPREPRGAVVAGVEQQVEVLLLSLIHISEPTRPY